MRGLDQGDFKAFERCWEEEGREEDQLVGVLPDDSFE